MCETKLHYRYTVFLEWLVQVVSHLKTPQYFGFYVIVKQLLMSNPITLQYRVYTNMSPA